MSEAAEMTLSERQYSARKRSVNLGNLGEFITWGVCWFLLVVQV